jgi:hypothetical protein
MALIACKECGKDISDKASSCPSCGAPVGTAIATSSSTAEPKKNRKTTPVAWAALVALVVGAVWFQVRESHEQSLPPLPVEVKYRGALLGPGMVLHVENTSDRPLFALVRLRNPTTSVEKSFRIDMSSKGSAEIGHKEGWILASGDTFELVNDGFRSRHGSIP